MATPTRPVILELKGIDQVLKNLNRANVNIGRAVQRGLVEGAKYLRNESRAIVPVQTGALKASAFMPRNVGGSGFKADIVIGYTADYAVYVHEDPSKAHGAAFNVKHAAEIAAAGHYTKSGKWKADTFAGTAQGGMFPRKPEEQYKFLEKPMREKRRDILRIIANAVRGVR